jgi:hypothetical protein
MRPARWAKELVTIEFKVLHLLRREHATNPPTKMIQIQT